MINSMSFAKFLHARVSHEAFASILLLRESNAASLNFLPLFFALLTAGGKPSTRLVLSCHVLFVVVSGLVDDCFGVALGVVLRHFCLSWGSFGVIWAYMFVSHVHLVCLCLII